jgi:hypothetical protein
VNGNIIGNETLFYEVDSTTRYELSPRRITYQTFDGTAWNDIENFAFDELDTPTKEGVLAILE